MKVFKKILSISALSLSALLLILSAIDLFIDFALFEWLPLKIAVVLMLVLSLAVTLVACFAGAWRKPLLLLACLLQTPVAGGVAVVWVYGLCFPEALPLLALFPFLVAFAALASVIQALVILVGEGMYEPLEDSDEDEDEYDFDEDDLDEEEEDEDEDVKIASPKKPSASAEEDDEDDLDDLSPDYKKSKPTAVAQGGQKPAAKKKASDDPFAVLREEVDFDQWQKSVKGIFNEKKDGE